MVGTRAVFGPLLAIVALRMTAAEPWLGAMIAVGFLFDVYDGILARRWGTASAALRVADSAADTVFYIGVLVAVVERHWPVIRDRIWWLVALLLCEGVRWLFDWIKYRRMASYHSYASKLWSALLAVTTICLLCFDRGYWLVTVALVWGILCDVEGLTMSALLPEWTHDVKSLRRAFALRCEMLARVRVESIAK
jgi:CDP-diacylglycerol--glycerol-3-phosphate 3-phosphatidyltransferase